MTFKAIPIYIRMVWMVNRFVILKIKMNLKNVIVNKNNVHNRKKFQVPSYNNF